LGFLTIRQSNGWHVDESIKAIGGGAGAFKIRADCQDGRFEARVDVMTPYLPVLDLQHLTVGATTHSAFTAIEVSPRWDMRVVGKPYYELDRKHDTGGSDALRIGHNGNFHGLLIRGRTSTSGQLCYVRDPGHSAIGRPNPSLTGTVDSLVVERDFSVYLGGMQYQRAFALNGDSQNLTNCTISGRIYGQRTPSQIMGNVQVIGAEFHYGQQKIPAAADNNAVYPNRFNGTVHTFDNGNANGKNRDAEGLVVFFNGIVEVRDCVFNAVHGPALFILTTGSLKLDPNRICRVQNCNFINSGAPESMKIAFLIDTRNGAPGATHVVDNVAVGYADTGGAAWTSTGNTWQTIRPEDLGTAAGVAENAGWQRAAFAACFG
jgi:hypothetical protein